MQKQSIVRLTFFTTKLIFNFVSITKSKKRSIFSTKVRAVFSANPFVRVYNGTNAAIVMTQKDGSTVVGTMSVGAGAVELIIKQPAHTLEGGAGLKAVHVAHKH